jgi:hypothetical protein
MISKSKADLPRATSSLLKHCAKQLKRNKKENKRAPGELFLRTTLLERVNHEDNNDPPLPTSNDDNSAINDPNSNMIPQIDYTVTLEAAMSSIDLDDPRSRRTTTTSSPDSHSVEGHLETDVVVARHTLFIPPSRNIEKELRILNVIDSALDLLDTPFTS